MLVLTHSHCMTTDLSIIANNSVVWLLTTHLYLWLSITCFFSNSYTFARCILSCSWKVASSCDVCEISSFRCARNSSSDASLLPSQLLLVVVVLVLLISLLSVLLFHYFIPMQRNNNNNFSNNSNFRGAGSRSDQCLVNAWLNKKVLRLD